MLTPYFVRTRLSLFDVAIYPARMSVPSNHLLGLVARIGSGGLVKDPRWMEFFGLRLPLRGPIVPGWSLRDRHPIYKLFPD